MYSYTLIYNINENPVFWLVEYAVKQLKYSSLFDTWYSKPIVNVLHNEEYSEYRVTVTYDKSLSKESEKDDEVESAGIAADLCNAFILGYLTHD